MPKTDTLSKPLAPPTDQVTELAKAIFISRVAHPEWARRDAWGWHADESFKAAAAFYADLDTRSK